MPLQLHEIWANSISCLTNRNINLINITVRWGVLVVAEICIVFLMFLILQDSETMFQIETKIHLERRIQSFIQCTSVILTIFSLFQYFGIFNINILNKCTVEIFILSPRKNIFWHSLNPEVVSFCSPNDKITTECSLYVWNGWGLVAVIVYC